jgi:hypothetical protein
MTILYVIRVSASFHSVSFLPSVHILDLISISVYDFFQGTFVIILC